MSLIRAHFGIVRRFGRITMDNSKATVLSKRGQPVVDPQLGTIDQAKKYIYSTPFSRENPDGFVNMGIACNTLVHDIICEKMMSICKEVQLTSDMLNYNPLSNTTLRKAVVGYLGKVLHLPQALAIEQVFITSGVAVGVDCLMHIICDPGDGVLCATPCYGRFRRCVVWRAGVKLIEMGARSDSQAGPFRVTLEDYEEALLKARDSGVTVRALLVTNPHNPIGYILTKEELQQLVQFAHKHSIHLIVDEIYMKSLVNPDAKFTSVLELEEVPNPEFVHAIWGPSKDFGIPNFKVGSIVSRGSTVVSACSKMDAHTSVSCLCMEVFARFLNDWDWLSKVYFPTQMELSRKALKIVTSAFDDLGVPYLRPDAGLFLYTDLRKFVSKLSSDPSEGEQILFQKFLDAGVYIAAGSGLCISNEYGWFRPIFTVQLDHLEAGTKRICSVLKDLQ
jgi:aspartate/methionine/tyrosine aminotransferase